MAKTARSARGEIVDFDIIFIKNELANALAPTEVMKRQNFIDSKLSSSKKEAAAAAAPDEFDNSNEGETIDGVELPIDLE
jgi:hypothetical protein